MFTKGFAPRSHGIEVSAEARTGLAQLGTGEHTDVHQEIVDLTRQKARDHG